MNLSLTFKGIIKDYTHTNTHTNYRNAKQQKKVQSPAACQSQNPPFLKVLSSKFTLLSMKGSLWCNTDCKNLYLICKDQLPRRPIHLPAFIFFTYMSYFYLLLASTGFCQLMAQLKLYSVQWNKSLFLCFTLSFQYFIWKLYSTTSWYIKLFQNV